MYVIDCNNYTEYQQILKNRISAKINALKQMSNKGIAEYIAQRTEEKKSAGENRALMQTKTAPVQGSESHTVSVEEMLFQQQLQIELEDIQSQRSQLGVEYVFPLEDLDAADRNLALDPVPQIPNTQQWASVNLHNDRDVVLAALQQNPNTLQYASDTLLNDRNVVLAAVRMNGFFSGTSAADIVPMEPGHNNFGSPNNAA